MRKKILITNDDGIQAEGLKELWKSLAPHHDITIVAPHTQRSGAGLGITIHEALKIQKVEWAGCDNAYSLTGTPADCVKIALSILLEEMPDLIVSGINNGSNAGRNVLYSGTIGGVIEGVLRGIPGIAFSSIEMQDPLHHLAANYAPKLVKHALEHPLAKGTLLNVNFPTQHAGGIQGIRLARQGRSYYIDDPTTDTDHTGDTVHWLNGKYQPQEEHIESDIHLLNQGYATVVPIHVEELTDFEDLDQRRASFSNLF